MLSLRFFFSSLSFFSSAVETSRELIIIIYMASVHDIWLDSETDKRHILTVS